METAILTEKSALVCKVHDATQTGRSENQRMSMRKHLGLEFK